MDVPVSADGIRCRMSGSDHPTASLSAQGSREAGKGAVLGVNYGESEKYCKITDSGGALIDAPKLAAYGGAARRIAAPAAPLGAAARRNLVARCARKISLPASKSRPLFAKSSPFCIWL